MKLQNHIISFASNDEHTLALINSFKDYYNSYLKENGVDIAVKDTVSFAEKEQKINEAIHEEIVKRSNLPEGTSVADKASNPLVQWATFAIITNLVDSVIPESLSRYIGLWADVQYGGYGDIFEFRRGFAGVLKVTKAGHAQRLSELQRIVKAGVIVRPENHMLTMETDLYRLMLGLDSVAEMTAIVTRSMAEAIATEAFSALANAVSALPTDATLGLVVTGYTQKALMKLIGKVQAYNGGMTPWIVGTAAALSEIIPTATYASLPVDSRYFALGHVTQALGSPVFVLPQLAGTALYTTALSDAILYIMPVSGKPIKVAVGGEMQYESATYANANLKKTVTMQKDFGVAAVTGMVFGVMNLTGV